jgi:hypothetical protein
LPKVGFFSTDWIFEQIPDPAASLKTGRPEFRPGRRATFGGTYHYRMGLPSLELAKHGYQTIRSWAVATAPDGHLRVMDTDGTWHDDCDTVIFQRWMHGDGADRACKAIACGQTVIQDVDDQFWALPKTNIAARTTDPAKSKEFNRDHYRKMLAASSAIICSTPAIASSLERLGPPVFVCRNAIDIDRWTQRDPGADGMVGWVGGIPWRGNDLPLLRGVLGPFLELHGLPFYHGGHDPQPDYPKAWEQLGIDPAKTQVCVNPLVPVAVYPKLWEPVALAVIPLEDSTFNRGKSWLKGLEAAACGVPFIASRLSEYEALGCGRLAKTRQEWTDHLEALLDPAVRRAEGAVNRARAEQLSIDKQWQQWDAVLRQFARQPAAA